MTAADQRQSLHAAILDAPDDDSPRLILADWLEEHGDESDRLRAEFIRLQIAAVRDPEFHGFLCLPERPCRNCRRERQLIGENVSTDGVSVKPRYWEWCEGFDPSIVPVPGYTVGAAEREKNGFRRGFVSEVRAPLQSLLDHGPAIVAAHPVTRMVATDREPAKHYDISLEQTGKAGWFMVSDGGDEPSRDELSFAIWRLLPDGEAGEHERWRWYTDQQVALDALSLAILTHCRALASGKV